MELQLGQVTGLAILQSCKLFGIPEEKFNLESQLVERNDLSRVLLDIGAEEQSGTNALGMATVN